MKSISMDNKSSILDKQRTKYDSLGDTAFCRSAKITSKTEYKRCALEQAQMDAKRAAIDELENLIIAKFY